MATYIEDILKLPVDERLEIIEKIWESLEENVPDTDYEITVAKERYEEYQKNSNNSLDWKDVKNQLFRKYGLDNKD
ncbi:MAG: addiction module protein [Segetibacter sp.]